MIKHYNIIVDIKISMHDILFDVSN